MVKKKERYEKRASENSQAKFVAASGKEQASEQVGESTSSQVTSVARNR